MKAEADGSPGSSMIAGLRGVKSRTFGRRKDAKERVVVKRFVA